VQRLKTRAQFQAVMAGGTVSRTAHFALHRAPFDAQDESGAGPDEGRDGAAMEPMKPAGAREGSRALFAVRLQGEPWIGAIVPKRWARRAVTRNAIKRQIYAVSQAFQAQLPAAAHAVRLRAGFDRAKFVSATSEQLKAAVRAELQQLFSRASA
jgi:ribonuclease P protein component